MLATKLGRSPATSDAIPLSAMNAVLLLVGLLVAEPAGAAHSVAAPPNANTQPPGNYGLSNYDNGAASNQVMEDIANHQSSMHSRSSPQCWMSSITTVINHWHAGVENNAEDDHQQIAHSSGKSFCASMTNDQQKVLALELTNCNLVEANRQMYDASKVNHETHGVEIVDEEQNLCSVGMGDGKSYEALSCLPLMTDFALNIYYQFLLDAQNVCTRLTEEWMLLQKERVAQTLVHKSLVVSRQMQSTMEVSAAAMENARRHSALLEDQSIMMREQMEEMERMYHAQSSWMTKQQERSALAIDVMVNQTASFLKAREKDAEMAVDKMKEQSKMIAENADKIKEQERDLERIREVSSRVCASQRCGKGTLTIMKMHILIRRSYVHAQVISSTSSQMQPLSNVEAYVTLITGGFTILKALFNFFLSINIAWMITSLPLLCRGRRYLFAIFTLGFLIEIALSGILNDRVFAVEHGKEDIETIRYWTRACASVALLLSFFVSCFLPPKEENPLAKIDELLRSQMEIVSRLTVPPPPEARARAGLSVSAGANPDETADVRFREGRGRSARKRHEDQSVSRNREFKPRRRRSKSPYRSSFTELALPEVTPMKRVARNDAVSATAIRSRHRIQSTNYAHRSDSIAKEKEEAYQMELECLRAMQRRATSQEGGREETCGSSLSDESDLVGSASAKRVKKRKVSEMYASSGYERDFLSANDEDMSTSSAADSDASPSTIREKKKRRMTNVQTC